MGIFNSMIQLRGGDYSSAMNPTARDVFTPSNPGKLDTVRTAPIVPNTRSFTPVEAARLTALAEQKAIVASASEEAYTALESLEESDAMVHTANRKYRGRIAKLELTRKQSDSKYLSKLNELRGEYGKAAAQLMETRKSSDQQLEVVEARTRQLLKGF
jgi:hypothetical protein